MFSAETLSQAAMSNPSHSLSGLVAGDSESRIGRSRIARFQGRGEVALSLQDTKEYLNQRGT